MITAKKNYTTTEREALEMIFVVQKFRHYLLDYPFTFYVDHDTLKYLIYKPDLSRRLAIWILLLQEFNFTVVVCPNKSHGNADHLSRLKPTGSANTLPLDDNLPNVDLFEVDVLFPKYMEILTYLETNQMPASYSPLQVQILIWRNAPYSLIGGVLYKLGKDGVLCRCINPSEVQDILEGCHIDPCGGHFAGKPLQGKPFWLVIGGHLCFRMPMSSPSGVILASRWINQQRLWLCP